MRIGILGGSFDPIHNAHLIIAQAARETLGLDHVRLMVAAQQPFKNGSHGVEAQHRLTMVQMAADGVEGLIVDRREVDRAGPSWTVETLQSLHTDFPKADLILLLGSDSARSFAQWHQPEQIRQLARIAVCARGDESVPDGFDLEWRVPRLEISSSAVRGRVQAGLSLAGWVPESVADYIAGLRLYGSRSA